MSNQLVYCMVAVNEDMIVIVDRADSADTENHTVFI